MVPTLPAKYNGRLIWREALKRVTERTQLIDNIENKGHKKVKCKIE